MTDKQIEAGLANVLQEVFRDLPGHFALHEGLAYVMAKQGQNVEAFKAGANSAGANL